MNFSDIKKIAIAYSEAKPEYFMTEEQYIAEKDTYSDAKKLAPYLEKMGFSVELVAGGEEFINDLHQLNIDFVINWADTVRGRDDLCPVIPASLDLAGIPYTGTGFEGLTINANKYITKVMLLQHGISVPRFQLITKLGDLEDLNISFPIIVKPNESHGSIGIHTNSVVYNRFELKERVIEIMKTYKQLVLLEEFKEGPEISVIYVNGSRNSFYPVQKNFPVTSKGVGILEDFSTKWDKTAPPINYTRSDITDTLKRRITKAFQVLNIQSYARFEMRLMEDGTYYIFDVNANPSFGPKEVDRPFSETITMHGDIFEDVLKEFIRAGLYEHSQSRKLPISFEQQKESSTVLPHPFVNA